MRLPGGEPGSTPLGLTWCGAMLRHSVLTPARARAFGLRPEAGPWIVVRVGPDELGLGWERYRLLLVGRTEEILPGRLTTRGLSADGRAHAWAPNGQGGVTMEMDGRGHLAPVLTADFELWAIVARVAGLKACRVWRATGLVETAPATVGNPGSRRKRRAIERADVLIAEARRRGRPWGGDYKPADFDEQLADALRALEKHRDRLTLRKVASNMGWQHESSVADALTERGLNWKQDIKSGRWLVNRQTAEK